MTVKFNKFNVTNGKDSARVSYSLDNHVDRKPCVTIYAKDYGSKLSAIIADGYVNNTDSGSDYFEQGRVHLREGHPLYAAARARAVAVKAEEDAKRSAKIAEQDAKRAAKAAARSTDYQSRPAR